jgi:hypothetical protein
MPTTSTLNPFYIDGNRSKTCLDVLLFSLFTFVQYLYLKESGRGTSRRKRGRPRKREAIYYKEEADSDDKEEDEEEAESESLKSNRDGKSGAVTNGQAAITASQRRKKRALVPALLKICAECGLKSASHHHNLEHWRKVRISLLLDCKSSGLYVRICISSRKPKLLSTRNSFLKKPFCSRNENFPT